MASKMFDAMQRFRKVEEATSAKDEPAPVFLLDELVEVANASAENAQALVDLVVKKLGHRSPIVRFKALRVVKHMCSSGGVQFQRFMQRHSSAIRECVTFKGEPDAFKGDVPNERVRELAKQVIELLFTTQTSSTSGNVSGYQGRIQGFGSGSSSQPYATSGSSSSVISPTASKYQGFGNPRFENNVGKPAPSATSTYAAAAGQAVAAAVSSVSSLMKATSMKAGALQEGMGSDSPRYITPESGPYRAPTVVEANQVLGSEQQLVDEICAPGGLRPMPNDQDLQVFADAAGALDGLKVGELLREKMESSSWQVMLRALCALSAIVERGSSQACGEVAVMFQSDPSPIRNALSQPHQLVQQQAAKVLKLILGEEAVPEPVRKPAKVGAPQAGRPGARSAAAAAAPAPAQDLLSLDSPKHAASSSKPQDALDLLGDFSPPASASAAPPADSGGDALFSGLDVSKPSPRNAPATVAAGIDALDWGPSPTPPPLVQAQTQSLDNLLDGLSISTPTNDTFSPLSQSDGGPSHSHSNAADLLLSSPIPPDFAGPSTSSAAPGMNGMAPGFGTAGMNGMAPGTSGISRSTGQPNGMGPGMGQVNGMVPGIGQVNGMSPGMSGLNGMVAGMGPPGIMSQGSLGMPGLGVQGLMGMPGMGMGQQGMSVPGMMAGQGMAGGQFMGMGAYQPQLPMAQGMAHGMGPQGMGFMQGPGAAPGMFAAQQQGGGGLFVQQANPYMAQQGGGNVLASAGAMGSGSHPSWQGADDLSALMRHVASHGKHDPAFDFIKDEFKTRS